MKQGKTLAPEQISTFRAFPAKHGVDHLYSHCKSFTYFATLFVEVRKTSTILTSQPAAVHIIHITHVIPPSIFKFAVYISFISFIVVVFFGRHTTTFRARFMKLAGTFWTRTQRNTATILATIAGTPRTRSFPSVVVERPRRKKTPNFRHSKCKSILQCDRTQ